MGVDPNVGMGVITAGGVGVGGIGKHTSSNGHLPELPIPSPSSQHSKAVLNNSLPESFDVFSYPLVQHVLPLFIPEVQVDTYLNVVCLSVEKRGVDEI